MPDRSARTAADPRSLLTLLTLAVGLLASLPAPATAAPAAGQFPYCSWWLETTPSTANVAFPDSAATYWTTPFLASDGLSIEVDGTYPDARYMSFNVYDDSLRLVHDQRCLLGHRRLPDRPLEWQHQPFPGQPAIPAAHSGSP